jgi:hypothetical protein
VASGSSCAASLRHSATRWSSAHAPRPCPSRSGRCGSVGRCWIVSGSRRKPGPLGPFVDGYRAWLVGRGYSPSVVVWSLVTLGHLGRGLERNALAVDQLTAEAASSFLAEPNLAAAFGSSPAASGPDHRRLWATWEIDAQPGREPLELSPTHGAGQERLLNARGTRCQGRLKMHPLAPVENAPPVAPVE